VTRLHTQPAAPHQPIAPIPRRTLQLGLARPGTQLPRRSPRPRPPESSHEAALHGAPRLARHTRLRGLRSRAIVRTRNGPRLTAHPRLLAQRIQKFFLRGSPRISRSGTSSSRPLLRTLLCDHKLTINKRARKQNLHSRYQPLVPRPSCILTMLRHQPHPLLLSPLNDAHLPPLALTFTTSRN
jgi:hypothetical protein